MKSNLENLRNFVYLNLLVGRYLINFTIEKGNYYSRIRRFSCPIQNTLKVPTTFPRSRLRNSNANTEHSNDPRFALWSVALVARDTSEIDALRCRDGRIFAYSHLSSNHPSLWQTCNETKQAIVNLWKQI